MLSLEEAFDWANAVGSLPRRKTGHVLIPGEDHSFLADIDPETGLVNRVATVPGSGTVIELTATWRLVPVSDLD